MKYGYYPEKYSTKLIPVFVYCPCWSTLCLEKLPVAAFEGFLGVEGLNICFDCSFILLKTYISFDCSSV